MDKWLAPAGGKGIKDMLISDYRDAGAVGRWIERSDQPVKPQRPRLQPFALQFGNHGVNRVKAQRAGFKCA